MKDNSNEFNVRCKQTNGVLRLWLPICIGILFLFLLITDHIGQISVYHVLGVLAVSLLLILVDQLLVYRSSISSSKISLNDKGLYCNDLDPNMILWEDIEWFQYADQFGKISSKMVIKMKREQRLTFRIHYFLNNEEEISQYQSFYDTMKVRLPFFTKKRNVSRYHVMIQKVSKILMLLFAVILWHCSGVREGSLFVWILFITVITSSLPWCVELYLKYQSKKS
ncbi:hypothetical protein K4L44_00980 [Halosquirtibacter laminarini]|uniref:Uncharacterized protein n=1 Tax=Halosquirtibacter laminarini TaxID=3374600 RepID=A0AC61NFR5_9BACT|nr:hypothetical protein K4L44_00980 [Prolixibacteraceae bacterium]